MTAGRGSRSRKAAAAAAAAARVGLGGADSRTNVKAQTSLDVVIEDAESTDLENVAPSNVQVVASKEKAGLKERAAETPTGEPLTSSARRTEVPKKLTVDVAAANSDAMSSTAASTPTSGTGSAPTSLSDTAVNPTVSAAPDANQAAVAETACTASVTVDSLTIVSVGLTPVAPPPPVAAPTAPLAAPPLPLPPHSDASAAPVIAHQMPHEGYWSYPSMYRERLRALGFAAMRRGPIWRPYAAAEHSTCWAGVDCGMPAAQALGLMTQHDIHAAVHAASAAAAISPTLAQTLGVHGPAYTNSVPGRHPLHPYPSAVMPAGLGLQAPPMQAHVGSVHALPAPHLHAHAASVQPLPAPHMQAHVGSVQAVPGVGLCSTGPQIAAPFPAAPAVIPQAVAPLPPSPATLPAAAESAAPDSPQLLLSIAMGQGAAGAGFSSTEIAEQLRAAAPCSYDD